MPVLTNIHITNMKYGKQASSMIVETVLFNESSTWTLQKKKLEKRLHKIYMQMLCGAINKH